MTWGAIKRNLTDKLFSDYIRIKAKWICELCKRDFSTRQSKFDCSHFYTRGNKAVRFAEENCSALCRGCHDYFGKNPKEHTLWMERKLGMEGFAKLTIRAHQTKPSWEIKFDEQTMRVWLKQQLARMGA